MTSPLKYENLWEKLAITTALKKQPSAFVAVILLHLRKYTPDLPWERFFPVSLRRIRNAATLAFAVCLKSRQQWQKAAPREGFNILDPFFTRCLFSLWTGHKEPRAGVRSGRGWMAGAGSSPHAGLLQPAMENRLGCMHSCGACSHYDDRAHSIFLLHVLFTAGWSWHRHSTEKVRNSSLRATKLFYTSARIKVKGLQEDKKTAGLHLTAAGCTQASWQSLHGLGCFDKTEPTKNPQGRNFTRVSGQSYAGVSNPHRDLHFPQSFQVLIPMQIFLRRGRKLWSQYWGKCHEQILYTVSCNLITKTFQLRNRTESTLLTGCFLAPPES